MEKDWKVPERSIRVGDYPESVEKKESYDIQIQDVKDNNATQSMCHCLKLFIVYQSSLQQ